MLVLFHQGCCRITYSACISGGVEKYPPESEEGCRRAVHGIQSDGSGSLVASPAEQDICPGKDNGLDGERSSGQI